MFRIGFKSVWDILCTIIGQFLVVCLLVYQRTYQNEVLSNRTGPPKFSRLVGPGPDHLEKECKETLQKSCHILTMLNAHVWLLFESLILSFDKVLIVLKSQSSWRGKIPMYEKQL